MALKFRAFAVLAEDLGSIPTTHGGSQPSACNSRDPREPKPFSDLRRHQAHKCTHTGKIFIHMKHINLKLQK